MVDGLVMSTDKQGCVIMDESTQQYLKKVRLLHLHVLQDDLFMVLTWCNIPEHQLVPPGEPLVTPRVH